MENNYIKIQVNASLNETYGVQQQKKKNSNSRKVNTFINLFFFFLLPPADMAPQHNLDPHIDFDWAQNCDN